MSDPSYVQYRKQHKNIPRQFWMKVEGEKHRIFARLHEDNDGWELVDEEDNIIESGAGSYDYCMRMKKNKALFNDMDVMNEEEDQE